MPLSLFCCPTPLGGLAEMDQWIAERTGQKCPLRKKP
jgi:hypothetical protein